MEPAVTKLPPYKRMIGLAIKSETNRNGASLIHIYKYIENNWQVGSNKRTFIKKAIQRQMESGDITQKGARYKLKTKPARRVARRERKVQKPISANKAGRTSSAIGNPKASGRKSKAVPKKATSAAPISKLVWFWQFYDNGWTNYHPDASAVVEGVYQDYLRHPNMTDVRSVKSGDWNYLVDFRLLQQQNIQHENHTVRKIRRVQIPVEDAVFRKNFGN